MTFNGAVVDCTFITAGASGRERCTKVSVATAILGSSLTEIEEVGSEALEGGCRSRKLPLVVFAECGLKWR